VKEGEEGEEGEDEEENDENPDDADDHGRGKLATGGKFGGAKRGKFEGKDGGKDGLPVLERGGGGRNVADFGKEFGSVSEFQSGFGARGGVPDTGYPFGRGV
jgi:hypothetical protein